MKPLLISTLIICFNCAVFAQQNAKTDDELLLDYYQTQRYADAADYLKKTYPEPITDLKILSKLAYSAQMAGKLADAESYYQRIYNNDSTCTAVLFNLGAINMRRGNNIKASIFYKKIVEKDTGNFAAYKQLAKISFDTGRQADMINYLLKANKINPAEPDVASDLGDMLINFKKFDMAEKVLNSAIAKDPENVELLMSLMKLNFVENKFTETKNTCLKLMALGDHSGYVLTKLGTAYYNLPDYECSIATFADIPEQEQGETSYYIAGMAYKAVKDYTSAIANLKKAIDIGISPNIADYYGEIAESDEKLINYKRAKMAYEKALQFSAEPTLYYLLANLYDSKLKNKKTALLYYKRYVAAAVPSAKKQTYIAYAKSRIQQLKN